MLINLLPNNSFPNSFYNTYVYQIITLYTFKKITLYNLKLPYCVMIITVFTVALLYVFPRAGAKVIAWSTKLSVTTPPHTISFRPSLTIGYMNETFFFLSHSPVL